MLQNRMESPILSLRELVLFLFFTACNPNVVCYSLLLLFAKRLKLPLEWLNNQSANICTVVVLQQHYAGVGIPNSDFADLLAYS